MTACNFTPDGTSSMLKSLDAKITNITNEQKKISPRAPSNSTSLSPSNHAHIPAIQRLGIDSDSTTAGPQRTYADSLAAPSTVHVPSSRSAKVKCCRCQTIAIRSEKFFSRHPHVHRLGQSAPTLLFFFFFFFFFFFSVRRTACTIASLI